jgi:hypothetical protein
MASLFHVCVYDLQGDEENGVRPFAKAVCYSEHDAKRLAIVIRTAGYCPIVEEARSPRRRIRRDDIHGMTL